MKKNTYLSFTEQEVRNLENNFYVIRLGGDFVREDDCYFFTKAESEKVYDRLLKDLLSIILDGSQKDSSYASGLISTLFIQPMRLH